MGQQPLVTNAANPGQVKQARRKEKDREGDRLAAYKAVLATPAGRRALWDILTMAGIYRSCYNPSGSTVYYLVGRQDMGHELQAALIAADDAGFATMEKEMRTLERLEDLERSASHKADAENREQ